MIIRHVIFRENSSSHEEEYLARADTNAFASVSKPSETNLTFDSAAEAYEFAAEYPQLQHWRVGAR
jgi:hypothetical protein